MTYVFEKDDSGLLHQVNMSLEDIAKAGRNIGMLSIQSCFVLFTAQQEKEFAAQKAEAKAKEDERLATEDKRRAERQAQQQEAAKNAFLLDQAKKEAEAQKDNALSIALDQLKALKEKIEAMEASSQPPQP